MRLWLEGRPDFKDEPAVWAAKAKAANPTAPRLGLYTAPGLAVRIRFVYDLRELQGEHRSPAGPPVATLAWCFAHTLEGIVWENVRLIDSLHAVREWGRVAGVEVIV